MKNIRRIIQMAVILISWGGLAVVSNSSELSVSTKVIPTANIHAQYASGYDGSIERTMDFAEYVFVGKVIEYCDTQYEDKVTFKNRYGKEQVGANAYTRYKVEILENIKNELPTGTQIIVKKLGGIREDLSCVDVLENDELPETNNTYVFMANRIQNEYIVAGKNTNIEVDETLDYKTLNTNNLEEKLFQEEKREK